MKMRLSRRLTTRLRMGKSESRSSEGGAWQEEEHDENRSRPLIPSSSSPTPRPNEEKANTDEATACDIANTVCKATTDCLESVQNADRTRTADNISNTENEVGNLDHDHDSRDPMTTFDIDNNDSDYIDESNPRYRRGLAGGSDNDESDSEDDDDDLADLDLPSGYLEFLSMQQTDVDLELSAVAERLRGTDNSRRCQSPIFQISFVREFLYDKGAVLIANAIEEGCSTCQQENHGGGIVEGTKSDSTNTNAAMALGSPARDAPILSSPTLCSCPSNLQEIVLSRCHIGDEGACALAHAISISGVSLKTLDLSSNNITGMGVSCLANSTVMHQGSHQKKSRGALGLCGGGDCSIETLVLSSNPILSEGAFALASALKGSRSRCRSHQMNGSDDALTNSSQDVKRAFGFCTLKNLHLSGCKLNDNDAQVLTNALLPHVAHSSEETGLAPTQANNLMLLNLHANSITIKGMQLLYSVIHNSIPDSTQRDSDASNDDDSNSPCLQSLYNQSNHTMELGLIVDYGTRDYNYGNFFDQEEDEELLVNMRNYEMAGVEPNGIDIEELKALMIQKWLLKERMMHDLQINRECAIALEAAALGEEERRKQIICSSARKKISHVLEANICPHAISLPRRQDEYGKYLDEEDPLGLSYYPSVGSESLSVGRHFASLELNMFPQVFCWINRHCDQLMTLAMVFDILCESPDVCSFHSEDFSGKMPAT